MDGSIRITTKIDTTGAKQDLTKLESEVEKAGEKIAAAGKKINSVFAGAAGKKVSGSFVKLNAELAKTESQLADIESQIAAVQAETDKMLESATTGTQVENLLEIESTEIADLAAKRDELTAKANEYREALTAITAEQEKQSALSAGGAALKDAKADEAFLGSIGSEKEYDEVVTNISAKMATIEQLAARIAQENNISVQELLAQDKEYANLNRLLELLKKNQGRFAGKVKDSTKDFDVLGKEAQKVGHKIKSTMDHAIKRVTRMALGVLGIRGAFMLLRRAASAYMEDNEELKNQLNAIWNVLGTAIGPVIEKLVGWLTTAITWINALVLALTGVNIVAKANEAALRKQEKATKAAAASLAGFDEMNKLSDSSSNDGAGASGQFQLADIDTSGAEKVAGILKEILPLILGIGAGLLTWKVLDGLGLSLSTVATWSLIIAGAVTAIAGYIDAWNTGIDWGNLLQTLGGIAAVLIGLAIAIDPLAAGIGAIVGGIMLLVLGIKDWLESGKSLEALSAIEIGLLAIGGAITAIFFATVGWIPLIIAAVVGAITAIIMYFDEIWAAIKSAWTAVTDWLYNNIFGPICDAITAVWEWLDTNFLSPLGEAFKAIWNKIVEIWNKIKEIFVALWGAFLTYVWNPLWEKITNIARWVYEKVLKPIGGFFSGIGTWIYNKIIKPVWDKIIWLKDKAIEIFKKIGSTVVNFITDSLKSAINGVLSSIEWGINLFIKLLNGAIDLINKIPGVNITHVEELVIPKLARGGIVNNPGRGVPAIIGEAGKEAVLPLENNTEWMDTLADRIGGKSITVQVILSGKKIYEEIIDLAKKRQFATNGVI